MFGKLASYPAFWGAGGAFIYAANEISVALLGNGGVKVRYYAQFVLSIMVGAFGAAAFAEPVQAVAGHDMNSVSAMIGLLMNRMAPKVVDGATTILSSRVFKLLKGDEPK